MQKLFLKPSFSSGVSITLAYPWTMLLFSGRRLLSSWWRMQSSQSLQPIWSQGSTAFIVPKKGGGLMPILDLRVLNRSLHRLLFKMLTQKHIFECIRPRDWFAVTDLKDAYFHVSILPRHWPFLQFAFEGRAYQYKVLTSGWHCRLVSLQRLRFASSTTSTTDSSWPAHGSSCANTGTWC